MKKTCSLVVVVEQLCQHPWSPSESHDHHTTSHVTTHCVSLHRKKKPAGAVSMFGGVDLFGGGAKQDDKEEAAEVEEDLPKATPPQPKVAAKQAKSTPPPSKSGGGGGGGGGLFSRY